MVNHLAQNHAVKVALTGDHSKLKLRFIIFRSLNLFKYHSTLQKLLCKTEIESRFQNYSDALVRRIYVLISFYLSASISFYRSSSRFSVGIRTPRCRFLTLISLPHVLHSDIQLEAQLKYKPYNCQAASNSERKTSSVTHSNLSFFSS